MNKQRDIVGYSLILTALYVVWLLPGYWNLGFSLINTLFLVVVWKKWKAVGKDGFLRLIWGLSLGLGWFMSIRSFEVVRLMTWLAVIILGSILITVGKKPKAKLTIKRIWMTKIGLVGEILSSWKVLTLGISKLKFYQKGEGIKKVIVGVLLSVPLLVVFGTLFYGADPIFARIVNQIKLPDINIDDVLVRKVLGSLIFFGVVFGLFKNKLTTQEKNIKWLKSITETNVAVMILEMLFVAFCAVQIRYFWASQSDLRNLGIVFSEYTRSGYGQMIVASILTYGVVLRLEYSLRSQVNLMGKQSKLTKWLIWSMLIEILIFIVAATKRNYIYQSAYGFTEIRLLGFALSIWLVVMVGLVAYKVWGRKKSDFFVRGAILLTTVSILGLNLFNVDRTIVAVKPASLDSGTDYKYMSTLSDDAWRGWGKILANTEDQLSKDKLADIFSVDNEISIINRLKMKKTKLGLMSENGWHWGGSYNYSGAKSLEYLEDNSSRIELLLARLGDLKKKKIEERKFEILKELESNTDEGVVLLRKSHPNIRVTTTTNSNDNFELKRSVSIESATEINLGALERDAYDSLGCKLYQNGATLMMNGGISSYAYELSCSRFGSYLREVPYGVGPRR